MHLDTGFRLNAVGRDAVDFTDGQLVPDGETLDGVSNGFVVLQPGELLFEYEAATGMAAADIIGIVFIDDYGPPGLLGYRSTPGTSNWSPFIFDFKEGVTSCGNTDLTCFFASGLNSSLPPFDTGSFIGGSTLCGGGSSQEQPGLGAITGWTRIFVSGLGDFENQLGLILNGSPSIDAFWMKARP